MSLTAAPAPRAVLYLRLSAVVDDSTSIARQERDLRELADRSGWNVVDVLVDNGISGRKEREKALEAARRLADGEADVLAVWKLDRFTRQGVDGLGAVLKALDKRRDESRPALFVALRDGLTSDQAAFRLIAAVLSEVARTEAEATAARVRSSIEYRRTVTHKVAGGGWPFGYRSIPAPDGVGKVLVPVPEEAEIVREIARRLTVDGDSVLSIVHDLDARRIPTGRSQARTARLKGKPWEHLDRGTWATSSIRRLMQNQIHLGRQPFRGDVVRDADGMPVQMWEPTLDPATFAAVRARFESHHVPNRRPRRARLLSGLAFCQKCGNKLYVTSSGRSNPSYRCSTNSAKANRCGAARIVAGVLERHVSEQFLAIVRDWPEYREEIEGTGDATELELAEVEAALVEATQALLADDADVAALSARVQSLRDRRAELRARPAPEPSRRLVPTGRTMGEAWDSADMPARRRLLESVLDHVEVGRARHTRDGAEGRVVLRWKS